MAKNSEVVRVKFTPVQGEERELIRYEILDGIVICGKAKSVIANENTFIVDDLVFRRIFGDNRWDFFNQGEEQIIHVRMGELGYDKCDAFAHLYDLSDYGDVMSLERFFACCVTGLFMDHDGFGYYVYEGREADWVIKPSTVLRDRKLYEGFEQVIWFNK